MEKSQNNKTQPRAIVTGSEGDIGSAICLKLKDSGYKVLGVDKKKREPASNEYSYLKLDLGEIAMGSKVGQEGIKKIKEWLGEKNLTLLVNNAAIQTLENSEDITRESWRNTFKINVDAPFFLCKELLPSFCTSSGSVINISSIHSRLTKPKFVAYSTSKAALSALTKALAVDLGDKIRVNAIEPAAISTEMLKAGFNSSKDKDLFLKLKNSHPQKRIGSPQEVANLVIAITSGSLKFLHGSCIDLSGGISSRLHDPI